MMHVVEAWVEAPLLRFVEDARIDAVVLMHPSGQVLAQDGFARSGEVMSACALAAAIHASASELGRQLDGRPFRDLHYAGAVRQLFLTAVPTPRGEFLLLAVFGEASSLGLLQVFVPEVRAALAAAAPALSAPGPALAVDFERDLNRNLATLFGRGG